MRTKNSKKASVFGQIGARNYATHERVENDYYATDPNAINRLKKHYDLPHVVYECACGEGNLSKRLKKLGHRVYSSDLVDRGWGNVGVDFLKVDKMPKDATCIITNPPFSLSTEFVSHALELIPKKDGVVAMFMKIQFLESKGRYESILKQRPPEYMFQFIDRVNCWRNNDKASCCGSVMAFAWFVWDNKERTRRQRSGEETTTRIYWI